MKGINLRKIIEHHELDSTEIAKLLFPKNRHPLLALNRILFNKAVLDADQISRFSMFTGIPIADLYDGTGWQSRYSKGKHILTSGDYRAELDTETWSTKVFKNDTLYHEFIMHAKSITLSEYIQRLDSIK